MSCKQPHVLSIQSHVVSGYVGNKSATFPLQLLGFDVDTINSVQLSNHTGYKVFKGQVLNDQDLICDPVLGDNGHMYVPEELKNIYKNDILPLADIITPNQFELELLTGLTIKTMSELKEAIKVLHSKGPKIVAVSSTDIENKLTSVTSVSKDNTMIKIEVPRIPAIYTGSGDLFAALLLAHTYLEDDIKISLEKTINTLFEVLEKTYHHSLTIKEANAQQAKKIELRLIQSKKNIENPNILLRAVNF
ncbi:pyridoxal kinase isoform X2 [Belonocnema kinseyi]|uniref:pyridoxal kinase isoform X2 n=1 Tax=Belonocnema kinseyi TaxID=2817044 RepID=UPI00143DA7EF|nr:pyridoxal kinase isoform X2 [Belonocnema kinseyi]